jgi:hypothetical protein
MGPHVNSPAPPPSLEEYTTAFPFNRRVLAALLVALALGRREATAAKRVRLCVDLQQPAGTFNNLQQSSATCRNLQESSVTFSFPTPGTPIAKIEPTAQKTSANLVIV